MGWVSHSIAKITYQNFYSGQCDQIGQIFVQNNRSNKRHFVYLWSHWKWAKNFYQQYSILEFAGKLNFCWKSQNHFFLFYAWSTPTKTQKITQKYIKMKNLSLTGNISRNKKSFCKGLKFGFEEKTVTSLKSITIKKTYRTR